MKVSEKIEYAKKSILLISTHDDEDEKKVEQALDELTEFIKKQKQEMKTRRAAKNKKAGDS